MFRSRRFSTVGLPIALVLIALGAGAHGSDWDLAQTPSAGRDDEAPIVGSGHTVARVWNEALLDAIRIDRPKPPVHARNLFHLSVAMWDAWAAYDPDAFGYLVTEKPAAADVETARRQAISHAAYRLLMHRFPGGGFDLDGQPCQPGAEASQGEFTQTMEALGYDPAFTSTVGDSPAALGNRIGQAVIDYGLTDGANEGFDLCYFDDTGYFPLNPELIFLLPGTTVFFPNHWQPLAFDFLVLQNGIIIGQALQSFVGVGWGDVAPFGLTPDDIPPDFGDPTDCDPSPSAVTPYLPVGCPPQLGGVGDEIVKDAVVELIRYSSYADPGDAVEIDISPSAYGNHPLGTDDGTGHTINPFTGEPYPPNVVKRGDWTRVLAEFWADGPHSETPPGHWNTLANYVTDHPDLGLKRLGGTGPLLDDLEWDVKLYLALNGAEHDAAIAAWGAKHYYDSSRPITLIRHMGGLGHSSVTSPDSDYYHPDGLPLEPGLIEVITDETTAPGGRHEHLANHCELGLNDGQPCESDQDCPDDGPFDGMCVSSVGQMAIRAWRGGPEDPVNEIGGVGWIRAIQWMPYQASNFVTPPFPGYTSGHSSFSRVGAEVLAGFTGSEFFPGGLGTFVADQNTYLRFEQGPTETLVLQWATYADAGDEAGASRRYGGIHPYYDDYPGRIQAVTIGQKALATAFGYFNQDLGTDDDEDEDEDEDGDGDDEDSDDIDAVGVPDWDRAGAGLSDLQSNEADDGSEESSGGALRGGREREAARAKDARRPAGRGGR